MGLPARIVRFLGLTAWDVLLPDLIEKPVKIALNLYHCFVATDPAEKLALLAEARQLSPADIEAVVNHLAVQMQPLLRGTLTDQQRHILRGLVVALHTAGQPAAATDPAKAMQQSLQLRDPKSLAPEQRAVCRSMVQAALHGQAGSGPQPLPPNPPTIPGYTLLRILGKGAFSVVYLAQHDESKALHALKVFQPENADQFRREIALSGKVVGQYIVRYLGHGPLAEGHWIAMEYLGDLTLRDLISARPSAEQSLVLAEQMLRGLDELHQAGVIHRDLKPENAVVDHDYRLRLIDFGLAKQQESAGVSTTLGTVGTALYMSPEHIHGSVSPASDVWSFGCVLYELLVGKPLFKGKNVMAVAVEITTRQVTCDSSSIPEEVRPFLTMCLHRTERYTNGSEALAAFLPVATEARRRLRYERYQASWNAIFEKNLLERFAEEHRGELPADAIAMFAAKARSEGIADVDEQRLVEILPPIFAARKQVLVDEMATAAAAAKRKVDEDTAAEQKRKADAATTEKKRQEQAAENRQQMLLLQLGNQFAVVFVVLILVGGIGWASVSAWEWLRTPTPPTPLVVHQSSIDGCDSMSFSEPGGNGGK